MKEPLDISNFSDFSYSRPIHKFSKVLKFSIGIVILGSLFKILHWPYGNIFILSGFSAIMLFYFLRFLYKPDKNLSNISKLLIVVFFCSHKLFTIFHLPYKEYLLYAALVALIGHYIADGFRIFTFDNYSNSDIAPKYSKAFHPIFLGVAILGALFKIMHWPYAGVLLTLGLSLLAIWFIKDMFLPNKKKSN